MRIGIYNLHSMCENNTFFLSRARQYFLLNGHTVSDSIDGADLVFIGGCAVTDRMRERCLDAITRSMESPGKARFIVFGCLAAFPEAFKAGPHRDRLHLVTGGEASRLDALIGARVPFSSVTISRLHGHVPYQPAVGPEDSYVLIGQGCVNHCSYCTIKKAKGHIVSRPEQEIENDVAGLSASGASLITLLADDCGSYGLDLGSDLPALLTRLCRTGPGVRYKLYTVFPALFLRFFERLEPLIAQRRLPYICVPAQSASPRVLSLMNRDYDPDRLAAAVARMRALDPNIFIYSHFLFGFPTETWEEFERSITFARHFDSCVFLGYGENVGTPAADLLPKNDDRTLRSKARRLTELIEGRQLAALVVPRP